MVFSCCTTSIQGGRDTSHNTISAVKTLLQDVRFKFQIYDKGYNSGGCAFVKTDTQERAWVPGLHVLLLVGVTSAATSHGKRWKGRASSHFLGQLLTKIEMAEMRLQLLRGLPKPNPDPERIAADGDYLKRYLALFYCQFFKCFSTCFSLFSSFSFFPTFHLVFPHVFQFFIFSNLSFGFSRCFSKLIFELIYSGQGHQRLLLEIEVAQQFLLRLPVLLQKIHQWLHRDIKTVSFLTNYHFIFSTYYLFDFLPLVRNIFPT